MAGDLLTLGLGVEERLPQTLLLLQSSQLADDAALRPFILLPFEECA
jgi:hypothetical protein